MGDEFSKDPYAGASFVPKLKEHGIIFGSDYDRTQTSGVEHPSDLELIERERGLAIAAKVGAVTAGVSARSLGLMLSQEAFVLTQEAGFSEPEPRWHKNKQGLYEYIDPATVPYFVHNLDWDIVAGFGSGVLVKNGKGYKLDHIFDQMLKYDWSGGGEPSQSVPWRQEALAFLFENCSFVREFMPDIEFVSKYQRGHANVYPLNYRIQFNFPGSRGRAAMEKLMDVVGEETRLGNRLALRLQLVDESKIVEDPEECVYTLYLVPWYARKENMINRLIYKSVEAAGRKPSDVRVLYAGDAWTDLRAGLYGGGEAHTTFLLANGSRLAPFIMERRSHYGFEDLSFLWAKPERGRAKDRLRATGKKGVYTFERKVKGRRTNTIVIGDERYKGLSAPGSVATFLEEFL